MPALLHGGLIRPGLLAGLTVLAASFPLQATSNNPVIVHEWGTFTSLQDEKGHAIGGINVDDEPVPGFVCQNGGRTVLDAGAPFLKTLGLPPYTFDKGWPTNDPAVTMRLETPVIYIYPPKGRAPRSVPPLTVRVDFHGGVLSQFYPEAKFDGLPMAQEAPLPFYYGPLTGNTTTSLTWAGVRLGSTFKPVETTDRVWTTPREVSAPVLELKTHAYDAKGKLRNSVTAEHFLFYRGVGHLDSPLSIAGPDDKGRLSITGPRATGKPSGKFDEGWLVEIRPDGTCAFQSVANERVPGGNTVTSFFVSLDPAAFSDADFSAGNLARLKASMQQTLVKEGLYADEASAMLRTWELSYFKSPGLRFFYTVPRTWVDEVLPLKITGAPVKITRVMIGRVELISNAQRAAIARLAVGPCPDLQTIKAAAQKAMRAHSGSYANLATYPRGDEALRNLGIAVPPLVQDYFDLGRFRDELILRAQKENPSPALAEFIRRNGIGSTVTDPKDAASQGVTDSAHASL